MLERERERGSVLDPFFFLRNSLIWKLRIIGLDIVKLAFLNLVVRLGFFIFFSFTISSLTAVELLVRVVFLSLSLSVFFFWFAG